MHALLFEARDESETARLAQALAQCLPAHAVVVLTGPLGSGKTRLVQMFAAAQSIDETTVTSPTYVLCQEYHGDRLIQHLDVYRLQDEDEFIQLGPDEIFASSDVAFIEWGERVAGCLPDDRLEISIAVTGQTMRQFAVASVGQLDGVVECLQRELR